MSERLDTPIARPTTRPGPRFSTLLSSELPAGDDLVARAVVVGTGFGGSVAATRLAEHLGTDVLVLERGREILPGGFPRAGAQVLAELRTPANPLGLFDVLLGSDLDVLSASALGGGSQIYAGVTVPPEDDVFAQREADRRIWPDAIDGGVLRPHYDVVRRMLEVEPWLDAGDAVRGGSATPLWMLGGSPARDDALDPAISTRVDAFGRTAAQRPALAKGEPVRGFADRRGGIAYRPPLAITLTRPGPAAAGGNGTGAPRPLCIQCGCCVTGCNAGAKNTLTSTYLPVAVAAGARVASTVEVTAIRPGARRRWLLDAIDRSRPERPIQRRVHADIVILAAGSLRSTELLLRAPLRLSPAVGRRISANGDSWGLAFDGRRRLDAAPVQQVRPGPTITATARVSDPDAGLLVVQDGAFPASAVRLASRGMAMAALRPLLALRRKASIAALTRSQIWLAMGDDTARGAADLDRHGRVRVSWPGLAEELAQRRAEQALGELARGEGARVVVPPRRWGRGRTPVTVHPLGGCPMADDAEHGVVDVAGRVYDPAGGVHAGLYVLDGAICPTSLGVNPSLAIAALAERAMQEIVATDLPLLDARAS